MKKQISKTSAIVPVSLIQKPKQKRKDWHQYFLDIAKTIAQRASCDRLHVGAVIVDDHRILTTGYNGSSPRAPHCDEVGHLMIDGHCKRTSHAEMNAIAQAASEGVKIARTHIYITHAPCMECFRMILASGIIRITFADKYRLKESDIDLYNEIAGYTVITEGTPPKDEKYYHWNIQFNSNVWYKQ